MLHRGAFWTGRRRSQILSLTFLTGVPGNDVHPADAAPSLPQPAAGADPAEAASPHAPAGMLRNYRQSCRFMQVNAEISYRHHRTVVGLI